MVTLIKCNYCEDIVNLTENVKRCGCGSMSVCRVGGVITYTGKITKVILQDIDGIPGTTVSGTVSSTNLISLDPRKQLAMTE